MQGYEIATSVAPQEYWEKILPVTMEQKGRVQ